MKVIIFGFPGSGKGTQASLLEKKKDFFKISPGDLLRIELKNNSNLAFEIKKDIEKGNLIKDEIIFNLILKYLFVKQNILFDGYPRNLKQALYLNSINIKIDLIVNIKIDFKFILKRIKYRFIDSQGKLLSLLFFNRNRIRYKNDLSGLNFFKRVDDKSKIILNRVFEYEKQIESLIDFYTKNGSNILTLDGNQDINIVYMSIEKSINEIFV